MMDTDEDGKLELREMQHLLSLQYKWLRRASKNTNDWQVDAVVQHDTDLLWKKVSFFSLPKGNIHSHIK